MHSFKLITRFLPLALVLLLTSPAWGAVTETATVSVTPSTGTSVTTGSISTDATNPVLVVHVGLNSATVTVTSITTTGFGGATGTSIVSHRSSLVTTSYITTWCIPAPTAGTSGTVTVNFSASVAYQVFVTAFNNADQTTPCPSGDAVSAESDTNGGVTLTPTNLTANDASSGGAANTVRGNPTSVTPNQRYLNSSTGVNLEGGDATGTTGVTFNGSSAVPPIPYVEAAVRIKEYSAVATPVSHGLLLGVD
jgi:hypothetical protein